jgi:hypothetical protein
MREFERNPNWSKDIMLDVSKKTGLSEAQVYKWGWDQKRKKCQELGIPEHEMDNYDFGTMTPHFQHSLSFPRVDDMVEMQGQYQEEIFNKTKLSKMELKRKSKILGMR